MSYSGLLSIGEVNQLDLDQFIWLFGNVLEQNTEAAKYVFNNKPFKNALHIIKLFNKYLDTLSIQEQEKVLQQHPDLGSNVKMTPESTREQDGAGMNNLTENDRELLMEFNYRYKEHFGFPFVICARENNSDSVLENVKKRLENDKETELKLSIEEVKKIARLRILDLVWHS
ncbi:2-oxo-4-hydroxy-4-carboxy-5-ureidoimidazoline decarboxylase-like [Lycorma delicatula]|uniref:2-oxo-4-hydroxy-4-carboxy-5-ureidoimidazoline decarboxylase-like n=1 Tax=Lycorma delicatula TaxID=130591 RepID=UPI003F50F8AD